MNGTSSEMHFHSSEIEESWRAILNSIPAGAYTCDAEGLITYFSPHAEDTWGRAPKLNDPVDRYCGSFKMHSKPGKPIPHDECWMALALRDGKAYIDRELQVERPDGSRIMNRVFAHPVHSDQGHLVGGFNFIQRSMPGNDTIHGDATLAMIEIGIAALKFAPWPMSQRARTTQDRRGELSPIALMEA